MILHFHRRSRSWTDYWPTVGALDCHGLSWRESWRLTRVRFRNGSTGSANLQTVAFQRCRSSLCQHFQEIVDDPTKQLAVTQVEFSTNLSPNVR